jgi:DNA-directed RNA polymerase specialized sigma24 family protein
MAITITRSKLSFPVTGTPPQKRLTSCGQEVKKYKTLLQAIASDLGLNENESMELAEYVCLIGERNFADQKENFSLKTWLAKILVHNCIFKICSTLFSQNANIIDPYQITNNYLIESPLSKIPISFRTVYILIHSVGFTEPEVAQILNINTMQVRERLAKAMTIIKSQRF